MMISIKQWWRGKRCNQKQNWLLLAMACVLIAGGLVEQYTWAALIGCAPAFFLVWLEVCE